MVPLLPGAIIADLMFILLLQMFAIELKIMAKLEATNGMVI